MDERLASMCKPLEFQDRDTLRNIVTELKQSDGERWAIGEVIERLLDTVSIRKGSFAALPCKKKKS